MATELSTIIGTGGPGRGGARAGRRPGLAGLVMFSLALMTAPPQSANAFGTVFFQGVIHEKITRWALSFIDLGPDTLAQLAGKPLHYGAVGYPDQALKLIKSAEAHCDNGDVGPNHTEAQASTALTACRDQMVSLMKAAVNDSAGLVDEFGTINAPKEPLTVTGCDWDPDSPDPRAKCRVLASLGRVLHVSQDFYAHSNWTDIADGQDTLDHPLGLGNRGPAPFFNADGLTPYPPGLRTGCFVFIPEDAFCGGRTRHKVLNKDEGKLVAKDGVYVVGPGTTPRGRIQRVYNDILETNFEMAVNAAVADTSGKWDYFEQQVRATYAEPLPAPDGDLKTRGDLIVCVMKADYPRDCAKNLRIISTNAKRRIRFM